MSMKVLVIGLDCAEPSLVFDQWRGELPHLSDLMAKGLYGPLTSTIPPITIPAWASMLTGQDPGQLGLYGFRNRKDYSYDRLFIANSSHVRETTLYQLLSRARLDSILLGVPQTYPPRPLQGIMVSGFPVPGQSGQITYPAGFKPELDQAAGGKYIVDVEDFRTEDKDRLLRDIYDMTKARFQAARYLLENKPWDFFMMVEMSVDRIHHGFWRFHDPEHRLYEPGQKHEFAIRDYYRAVDSHVGQLVDLAPDGTLVMIVSDHGAAAMAGGVAVNEWLIRQGYLALKEIPDVPRPLTPDMVDWSKTLAWGEGGYYARLFMNVAGREPSGIAPQARYDEIRDEIKLRIESMPDHQGQPLNNRVFKPEEIYRQTNGVAPDLIIYFGNLAWRSVGLVGQGQPVHVFSNDTGPDDANHAQDGLAILSVKGADLKLGREPRAGMTIYDIAPTILSYFNLKIPGDMIGRVISF